VALTVMKMGALDLQVLPGQPYLGGGLKHFLFSPLPGEMIHFWLMFFKWVETTN